MYLHNLTRLKFVFLKLWNRIDWLYTHTSAKIVLKSYGLLFCLALAAIALNSI